MKRVLILVTFLAMAVSSCGGDESGSTAPGPEERVEMAGLAFSPESLTVAVGTTVIWENTDSLPHTTTSDADLWSSGSVDVGEEFSFTFDGAGTFSYVCDIHPSMEGTILVEG